MKKLTIAVKLIIILIISLITNNLFAQSTNVEWFSETKLLVNKYYFYDIHKKSTKYDSLKIIYGKRETIIDSFNHEYDSLKKTYTLKLNLQKKTIDRLIDQNKKLNKNFDILYKESENIIPLVEKLNKQNRKLKKILFIGGGVSTLLFILK